MGWMRVTMSRDEELGLSSELQDAFASTFIAAGAPEDAAMFSGNPNADDASYYFTPAAAELFTAVLIGRAAQSCSAPSRGTVSLLVGNGDPFDMLA